MEATLTHWGVKGQKWGVRRYQNEDGSLTEEGKKHYMKAAREGKLDPTKLSDADLDMINKRFSREAAYNKNIQSFKETTFRYKLGEAIIKRLSEKGKNEANKKDGFLRTLFVEPIRVALKEAEKDMAAMNKEQPKKEPEKQAQKLKPEKPKREKRRRKDKTDYSKDRRPTNGRGLPGHITLDDDSFTIHSGMTHFSVKRSDDYLAHHGILGQKWGVRRFQNEDGTLTEEGKKRYGSEKEQKRLSKDVIDAYGRKDKYTKRTIRKDDKIIERIKNSPQFEASLEKAKKTADEAVKTWNEVRKMEHDWYSSKGKEYDKYARKYAEKLAKVYDHSDKEEDIQVRLWLIKNDDLDQGDTFQMWLDDHPKARQKRDMLYKQDSEAYKKHNEACKQYASEWLGSHANDEVSRGYLWGKADSPVIETTADALGRLIARESYNRAYQ